MPCLCVVHTLLTVCLIFNDTLHNITMFSCHTTVQYCTRTHYLWVVQSHDRESEGLFIGTLLNTTHNESGRLSLYIQHILTRQAI
jgi:hypothetical protein